MLTPVPVTFARSRTKAATLLLGCVAFVVVSVFLMTTGPLGLVVGAVGVLTFGVFGVL
ncbi:hypothetical protein [Nocardioides zeicaulis]|uniref:Uncharacterized protein n=1 Tax=Nocardioides zeicaulis TaxID=1776857 RepID=A0ABV6E1A4_9ACTN